MRLNTKNLNEISNILENHIEEDQIPGANILYYYKGDVIFKRSIGKIDETKNIKMSGNAIFRIYSMTKPITSVGVLLLQEKGKVNIFDPISKYLPEFKKTSFIESGFGSNNNIKIINLLTHTSGISGGQNGNKIIQSLYKDLNINTYEHSSTISQSNDDLVNKIATVPLAGAPGEIWEYGLSADVLGKIIEVVSEQNLEEFFNDNIFVPLNMYDTSFMVKKNKESRIAQPNTKFITEKKLVNITTLPKRLSAGSGLYSTINDYLNFLIMLRNKGTFNNRQFLSKESINSLLKPYVNSNINSFDYIPGEGYGFGLGIAIKDKEDFSKIPVGTYFWLGRGATVFFVDPLNDLIGIFMSQTYDQARKYQKLFMNETYKILFNI